MKLKENSLCLSFIRAKRGSQRACLCSCPPCSSQNHPLYFKPQWLPSVSVGSLKLPVMIWPPSASPVRSLSDPQTHPAPCYFCVFKYVIASSHRSPPNRDLDRWRKPVVYTLSPRTNKNKQKTPTESCYIKYALCSYHGKSFLMTKWKSLC